MENSPSVKVTRKFNVQPENVFDTGPNPEISILMHVRDSKQAEYYIDRTRNRGTYTEEIISFLSTKA